MLCGTVRCAVVTVTARSVTDRREESADAAGEIDEAWIEEAVERYRRIESLQAEFDKAVADASR